MKLIVKENRDVLVINPYNTQNENKATTIDIMFPEKYEDFSKKIVFITEEGIVWDLIMDNTYEITRSISKYESVYFYLWLTKDDVDFRTVAKKLKFNKNEVVTGEVTPEEESEIERLITIMTNEVTEVNNLVEDIEGRLERGEFNGADGEKGEKGDPGEKGEPGNDGKDGLNGKDGVDGQDGKDGKDGINGVDGKDGKDGVNGQDGKDGKDGEDGYTPVKGVDYFTQQDIASLNIPSKTSDLTNDSEFINGLVMLTYGTSTWQDFIDAFNKNKIVYCIVNGSRLAFMAYKSGNNVEFQYYRSVATHSASQQGDQVFVYKLTNANVWTTETREAYTKIVAGDGMASTYSNGQLTLSCKAYVDSAIASAITDAIGGSY